MSLGNPSVRTDAVYEPRLTLNNQRYYAIIRGGNQITPYVFPAQAPSDSNLNFVCNPTSRNVIIDRAAQIRLGTSTNFTGTNAAGLNLFNEVAQLAPRSWPVSSITSTLNATVNGFGIVQQMAQVVHALECFNMSIELKNGWLSLLPQMMDKYQDYRLAIGANAGPLAGYSANPAEDPRGAYFMNFTALTATDATVVSSFYEWLMIPPWIFDGSQAGGLTNVDTLNFTFNLANLERMWSVQPPSSSPLTGPNLSNVRVSITDADMILFFITPRVTDVIPSEIVYPYYQIISYRTQASSNPIGFNAQANVRSNPIQLQSIPSALIFYVKQSDQVINANVANKVYYTDSFMKINSLEINFNNINGIYSGSSVSQLYQTSVLNDLSLSFPEWNGSMTTTDPNVYTSLFYPNSVPDTNIATIFNGTINVAPPGNRIPTLLKGGILMLRPARDIPLRDDEAPGKLGVYNLQVSMNVTNINPYSGSVSVTPLTGSYANDLYTPELNIIAINEGIMTIRHNSTIAQIGIVSASDCLNAPIRTDLNYSELERLYGGNIFEKIKSWGRKAVGAIQQYGPTILKGLEYAAPLVGLGEGGMLVGGGMQPDVSSVRFDRMVGRGGAGLSKSKALKHIKRI